jgi:3-phosphoshikimate 1-carboxyvinyltransferase
MNKIIFINNKIKNFKKKIKVEGDKSLSIRWALLASQAVGKSRAFNLLESEDVISTINSLKKLGIKIEKKKNYWEIFGKGLNNYRFKKNIILDAGNSGTLARLILGACINSPYKIKIIGDKSLTKRDFSRIIEPLKKFGANFYPKNKKTLPLYFRGTRVVKPIKYVEKKGSAQIKSSICLAALNCSGETLIKAKKSRDHTEILFKNLNIPIKIKKTKQFDFIKIKGGKKFNALSNYNIPGDISSCSFLLCLTLLSEKSELTIKNVNINPTRTGIISILNKMGANIELKNKNIYRGEKIADIFVKSKKNLKSINLPVSFNNSSAIDEFLLIFICCAFSKGISSFKGLEELNKKESKRLDWGFKILRMIGIKTKKIGNHGIKIWGQPNLKLNKNYIIKDYLRDHRVAMTTIILGLARGGNWKIHNSDSIMTSFPSFLKIIKTLEK